MADIRQKITQLYSLEQLSSGDTCVHRLHPAVKLLATFVYILTVVSFGRYEFTRLAPYVFYPVLMMSLSETPYRMIASRTAVAIPFCLFAGLSNVFFLRRPAFELLGLPVTLGMVSLAAILYRTVLCVSAVLILVAVTPFAELTGQLRRMRVPEVFLLLFEMTYRYIGTLLEEAGSMYTAYMLRAAGEKGLAMKHMGSFTGQLLLRSFDRAERVYGAMKCRGYALRDGYAIARPIRPSDWLFLALAGGLPVLFRLVDLPALAAARIGGVF